MIDEKNGTRGTRSAQLFVPGVALATMMLACGGEGESATPLRFATLDVSLDSRTAESESRVDPIVDALNAEAADVVCLQGLWTRPRDGNWNTDLIEDVLDRTAASYPHSYWERTTIAEDAPPSGCERDEADALLACVEPACGDAPPGELVDCVLAECTAEAAATSPMCQSCLLANGALPLDAIVENCRDSSRGGIWYDGHNGLALLSRHPLTETEHLALEHAVTARSVLHAGVQTPDRGELDVYCTETQAFNPLPIYPEDAPFASFDEENLAQVEAILAWVDQTATSPRILLGNFNHGPAGDGVQPLYTESYGRVLDAGYVDLIGDQSGGCSWCIDNPLVVAGEDWLMDHIYVGPESAADATAEIIFDGLVDITGEDGEPRRVPLSDHYGVAVTL